MSVGPKEAIEVIAAIMKEMKFKQEVSDMVHRADYEDYQLLFGETHHCEIQEKWISDVINFKSGDAKRQIQFQLNHLIAWQEWEKPAQGKAAPPEEKMSIDEEI